MRLARLGAALLGVALALRAHAAGTIDVEQRVPVTGAELYLAIRGADASAPILLWLHGGPGGAERPLFQLFNGELESHFVVAYLDQRGAGRSFDPEADPAELTIERHLEDLDGVVDRLTAELGRSRVTLIGHSWGSALGLLYAKAHPEKLAAFIGVGQYTSERGRQAAQFEFTTAEARRLGDDDAQAELARLGAPPYDAPRARAIEKLVDRFGGLFHTRPSFAWTIARGVFGGYVTPWELPRFFRANDVSLEVMHAELLQLDLTREVTSVRVPVFFLLGRYDRQVDSRQAAAYFETLAAPRKQLIWFERSAHNVPFEEPEAFDAAVVQLLRDSGVLAEASSFTAARANFASSDLESPARARSAIECSTAPAMSASRAGSAPAAISPLSFAAAKRASKVSVSERSPAPSFVRTRESRAASVAAVPIRKQPSGDFGSAK